MAKNVYSLGIAALILTAAPVFALPAAAQSGENDASKLGDDLITCASMEDDGERLICYDKLAQPLAGLDAAEPGGAAAALESFTGEDDWDSEVFEVSQPWRITWQTQASILTIELHGSEGELIDVIGNQIGAGGGASGTLEPGRYSLAARGVGSWRIKVLPAEE